MKKISAYIFSMLLCLSLGAQIKNSTAEPDTIDFPLKIRTGIDVAGPAIWLGNRDILSVEGYFSRDFNEKRALFIGGGYADFKYSQYNYEYLSKGVFAKAGIDFNILKPQVSTGKYWGGIGLRYGLSSFTHETPLITQENYWGTLESALAPQRRRAHFIELSPGFRAEMRGNLSIGWSLSLRKLIYAGDRELRPVYIPGYGQGDKKMSFGFSYFLSLNFKWKQIKVFIKPEPVEEPDEETEATLTTTVSY
jgi:hypothetical protein